jgi:hypothetical protein
VSQDFASRLEAARAFLRAHSSLTRSAVPVDLAETLRSLGFGNLLVERDTGRHGALRKINGRWHPVVYRPVDSRARLSARERFTVAHEIAHALIDKRFELRPTRAREYWALERVCDEYAADLLVPPMQAEIFAAARKSPAELAGVIVGLASDFEVSHAVAARRIVECLDGCAAWGIREQEDRRVISWDIENPPAFGVRRPSRVDRGSPLSEVLPVDELLIGGDYEGKLPNDYVSVCRRVSASFLLLVACRTEAWSAPDDDTPLVLFE